MKSQKKSRKGKRITVYTPGQRGEGELLGQHSGFGIKEPKLPACKTKGKGSGERGQRGGEKKGKQAFF